MEALSRMLERVEQAGLLNGFQVGTLSRHRISISHLLFADDTIVFCGADRLQLGHLRCTLLGFEAVSGLKVNLSKSEIIPIGNLEPSNDLAAILDCKIGSLPTTYLGLPLGAKFKSKEVWGPVIDRCRNRLAYWKRSYLSTGARLTLIKSTLSSLPSYFLSLFSAPVSVINELEKLQRDFLWGRHSGDFKHNLVGWQTACSSVKSGGVGIKKLRLQNEALLGKWLWRFSSESDSLWKRLIVSKYGEDEGGWCSVDSHKPHGVSLWKSIRQLWPKFEECIFWKLGRGDRTLFWKHRWLEVGCLADTFPTIFAIAANQDALVQDYYSSTGINRVWNVQLRRNVNDWEMVSFMQLLELLYSVTLANIEDSLIWNQDRKGSFNVRSFYDVLKGDEDDHFPWMKIWKSVAPSKVAFFTWCAAHGRILTIDNLQIRGYSMANRCTLCLSSEESIDHMFIHCPWTSDLWNIVLACFDVLFCPPKELKSFLLSWWGQPLEKRKKKIWCLIPHCLLWMVWRERNRRIFEAEGSNIVRLKSMFFNCLFTWVKTSCEVDTNSLLYFIDSLGKAG